MQSLFDLINLCSYNVHIWEDPVIAVLDKILLRILSSASLAVQLILLVHTSCTASTDDDLSDLPEVWVSFH
jgi:hypothetical protein